MIICCMSIPVLARDEEIIVLNGVFETLSLVCGNQTRKSPGHY
jgi:hypothetical protein